MKISYHLGENLCGFFCLSCSTWFYNLPLKKIFQNREINNKENKRIKDEQEKSKLKEINFGKFFEESYFPASKLKKKQGSLVSELALFKKWISPVLHNVSMLDIKYTNIEQIIKNMSEAKLSKRSIKYALSVISQVWTYAKDNGIVSGDSPTKKFTVGKLDNERTRFLTVEEANILIRTLGAHSIDLMDMSKLSLLCGLRAGEIFKLKWSDIDMDNETIILRNTKSGVSRHAYFAGDVKDIFLERLKKFPSKNDNIFPATNGKTRQRISKTFDRIVNELGLNNGITDSKQKVVFHTLRHTFASWLSQKGTSLYSIQNLMGHSEYRMTQRYAHLNPEGMRKDVRVLDDILENTNKYEKLARVHEFKKAE